MKWTVKKFCLNQMKWTVKEILFKPNEPNCKQILFKPDEVNCGRCRQDAPKRQVVDNKNSSGSHPAHLLRIDLSQINARRVLFKVGPSSSSPSALCQQHSGERRRCVVQLLAGIQSSHCFQNKQHRKFKNKTKQNTKGRSTNTTEAENNSSIFYG